jgi:hypothetical protein
MQTYLLRSVRPYIDVSNLHRRLVIFWLWSMSPEPSFGWVVPPEIRAVNDLSWLVVVLT